MHAELNSIQKLAVFCPFPGDSSLVVFTRNFLKTMEVQNHSYICINGKTGMYM